MRSNCQYRVAAVGIVLGMLAARAFAQSEWALPDGRLGVRTAPLLILTRPDVQTDMKLTSEQKHSLNRVVADLHAQAAKLKGKPDAEVIAARRTVDQAQIRWLESQLSAEQQERLMQIDLQWEGPSAVITRSWVAEFLSLTGEQRQRLSQEIAAARNAGSMTIEAHHTLAEKTLAVLNGDQKLKWQVLLGKPLELRLADAQK